MTEVTAAYQPMRNDRRDFNPMGEEWGYILDCGCAPREPWRSMVAVSQRPYTWPYQLHTSQYAGAYGSARLVPDWRYHAWGAEIVGASWQREEPHLVNCRLTIGRRYENGVYSPPVTSFTGTVTLGLLAGTVTWLPCPRDLLRGVPGDVDAEAAHKGAKLLAFFRAECGHWKAGDQERPVQARDLYKGHS